MPRAVLVLTLALPAVVTPAAAWGSLAEVFGLGSRSAALGGAVAARTTDFSSAHYNPAGLAFGRGKHVAVGALAAASRLRAEKERVPIAEPFGIVVGLSAPAPLGGTWTDRVHLGLALFVLPRTILRVIARLPDEPFFPYYDNRTQRLVVLPALAVRASDRLAFGVAVNFLAGLGGSVIAIEGPTRSLEPRVDEEIHSVARLNAGARWQLSATQALGLTFRQAFAVPFQTIADAEVAGEQLALDVRADTLFTPDQLVLGWAGDLGRVQLSADLTASRWSAYPGPYVRVTSVLPLVGPLAGRTPDVPWKDTLGLRLGAEDTFNYRDGGALAARLGYGYETSPVPAVQPGITNLLDGPKHTFSAGLGVTFPHRPGRPIWRVDVHAQAQIVGARTLRKRIAAADEDPAPFEALRDEIVDDPNEPATLGAQISNPGYPSIESAGEVYSAGMTLEISL